MRLRWCSMCDSAWVKRRETCYSRSGHFLLSVHECGTKGPNVATELNLLTARGVSAGIVSKVAYNVHGAYG
jgi:hypothetical protein